MATSVNNKPNLAFTYSGGNLVVRDFLEEYDDINVKDYVCIDLITHDDEITNARILETIEDRSDLEWVTMTLLYDGIHKYHRFMVPRLRKYVKTKVIKPNNIFYYKKEFYYSTEEINWEDLSLKSFADLHVIALKDLYTALEDGLGTEGDNDVIYNQYVIFSYELLKKAFVKEQDALINNRSLRDIVGRPSYKDRFKRDILLATIYAVREYIKREMFDEADIMIDALEGKGCLGITDSVIAPESDCGCGPALTSSSKVIEYVNEIETDDLIPVLAAWTFNNFFPIIFS